MAQPRQYDPRDDTSPDTPLTDTQRGELEQALARREQELQELIARFRGSLAAPGASDAGPEVRDTGEDSQVRMGSSQDLAQLDRCEHEMGEIAGARLRMREGTYGYCEDCGRSIPFQRLKLLPTARYCVRDEEAHERRAAATGT
jgi:RNA polymerase-binding transcription factor DksA